MTAGPTWAGSVLPDCYVGVPYLAGLPIATALSQNITAVSIQTASLAPPGLSFNAAGYVTGTVLPAGTTGSQVDGSYTFLLKVSDASNQTASQNVTMNVHYIQGDQDLSTAEQASLRTEPFVNTGSADASSFSQTTVTTDAG